jgi:uncharacterized protein
MFMPDVNVLVYAHRGDVGDHDRNARWLTRVATGTEPFALSELVVSGFVRVVTNRRIFRKPTPTTMALAFVNELTSRPTCRLVRPGARHLDIFLRLCSDLALEGGLVADAYHAALALEHGCIWVTSDTDFARFPELRWQLPEP